MRLDVSSSEGKSYKNIWPCIPPLIYDLLNPTGRVDPELFANRLDHPPTALSHCQMAKSISIKKTLALTLGIVALANSAGCPYSAGNDALEPRRLGSRNSRLEPRYHEDGNFGRCPKQRMSKYAGGGSRSWDWWPCELSLHVLRQNGAESNPYGKDWIYAHEFAKIDCEGIRSDELKTSTDNRSRSVEEGSYRFAAFISGLVAIRLPQLWRILDSSLMA